MHKQLQHKFLQCFIQKIQLYKETLPAIAVGLSGGADSVFLLHLFLDAQRQGLCTVIAAHLRHDWPATASTEALWCQELCTRLKVPFIIGNSADFLVPKRHHGSQEAVGHKQRRLFFDSIIATGKADFIALGHHQDDQLETFFIRLARGSSLAGLHGMNEVDGNYLRPLLTTTKAAILTALNDYGISFLHDATNDQDIHLRNKIRNHLIPTLATCDARFGKNIHQTITRLKQDNAFLQSLATQTFAFTFSADQPATAQLQALTTLDSVLLRRVILLWLINARVPFTPSEGLLEEIIRFLKSPHGGSHTISTHHCIIKKNSRVWIENTVG